MKLLCHRDEFAIRIILEVDHSERSWLHRHIASFAGHSFPFVSWSVFSDWTVRCPLFSVTTGKLGMELTVIFSFLRLSEIASVASSASWLLRTARNHWSRIQYMLNSTVGALIVLLAVGPSTKINAVNMARRTMPIWGLPKRPRWLFSCGPRHEVRFRTQAHVDP